MVAVNKSVENYVMGLSITGTRFDSPCEACGAESPQGMSGLLEGWTYDALNEGKALCRKCREGYAMGKSKFEPIIDNFRIRMACAADSFRMQFGLSACFEVQVRQDILYRDNVRQAAERASREKKEAARSENVAKRVRATMGKMKC